MTMSTSTHKQGTKQGSKKQGAQKPTPQPKPAESSKNIKEQMEAQKKANEAAKAETPKPKKAKRFAMSEITDSIVKLEDHPALVHLAMEKAHVVWRRVAKEGIALKAEFLAELGKNEEDKDIDKMITDTVKWTPDNEVAKAGDLFTDIYDLRRSFIAKFVK